MLKEKKILTIIPARAGSKRLPGKNIKNLAGKPLISYSIEYAKKHIKSDIIVSTDDKLIGEVAAKYGAEVQLRPDYLALDETSTIEVLQYVLLNLDKQYDFIVLLQPTSPLRPEDLFYKTYNFLQKKNKESLFTVSLNHYKLGKMNGYSFQPFNYEFGERSQDINPWYYENGLIYIAASKLIKKGILIDKNSVAMTIDHVYATVDVDDERDFKWAEYLIQKGL